MRVASDCLPQFSVNIETLRVQFRELIYVSFASGFLDSDIILYYTSLNKAGHFLAWIRETDIQGRVNRTILYILTIYSVHVKNFEEFHCHKIMVNSLWHGKVMLYLQNALCFFKNLHYVTFCMFFFSFLKNLYSIFFFF